MSDLEGISFKRNFCTIGFLNHSKTDSPGALRTTLLTSNGEATEFSVCAITIFKSMRSTFAAEFTYVSSRGLADSYFPLFIHDSKSCLMMKLFVLIPEEPMNRSHLSARSTEPSLIIYLTGTCMHFQQRRLGLKPALFISSHSLRAASNFPAFTYDSIRETNKVAEGLNPKPCISMYNFRDVSNLPAFPIESTREENTGKLGLKPLSFISCKSLRAVSSRPDFAKFGIIIS
ncbi:hypothetical protein V2J09_019654 [Rumex salicifolius]